MEDEALNLHLERGWVLCQRTATPWPRPFYSNALAIGPFLILQGAGVPDGAQVLQVPLGLAALFTDLNGDGKGDVVLVLQNLMMVLDGQTGRFLFLFTDLTGDGFGDLLMFNLDGTTTITDGRTGSRL